MENQHISSLFQKIKARLSKQMLDRDTLIRIILEETKINIKEDDIDFKKGILTLKVSQLKKNEVRIKKAAILARIAAESGVAVFDIR